MRYIFYVLVGLLISLLIASSIHADSAVIRPTIESNNLFNRIAQCESGNVATAKNKRSTASGRFQFLWGTWYYYGRELWGEEFYEKNIWDYDDNTELAWYVFTKYGTKDWESSKSCWSVL